ncbi:MAG TPA: N-acetylmuramic acid 6-phosphate etherase [Verrucomicrobiae bacterium]|nr:N-acetylmuramic acid 6-phosphate etherase [Verrucomicrobiae bacterium]
MPLCYLDAPKGASISVKTQMAQEITAVLDEAYGIDDMRIYFREYEPDQVSQDGKIGAEPIRTLFTINGPVLKDINKKRLLAEKINAAIVTAYQGMANVSETPILFNEYPLEEIGWAGRMQSDIPEMVEAMKQMNSSS